jgi:hypothetical protein
MVIEMNALIAIQATPSGTWQRPERNDRPDWRFDALNDSRWQILSHCSLLNHLLLIRAGHLRPSTMIGRRHFGDEGDSKASEHRGGGADRRITNL